MFDNVQVAWAELLAELRAEHDSLPELERPWLASRIQLMESTDMAVVVSQIQNESPTSNATGPPTSRREATVGMTRSRQTRWAPSSPSHVPHCPS